MNPEFLQLDLPPREAGPLALTHVTVVPMDSERRLFDHTVVIEGGVIREIVPADSFKRNDVRQINCAGKFLLPGLADMYTHYWDPLDAPLYLAAGVTTVRTVSTPFQLALGRVAARGEFPSPRMVNISPPIDGVGANGRTDMPRGVAMTRPEQAAGLVERFARGGYHQIKGFSLLTPDCFNALAKACTRENIRLTANCPNAMTFEKAIDAGVHCLEQLHNVARGHMRDDAPDPGFWDRFDPVPGTRLDLQKVRTLAKKLADKQVWNVPTLIFHQRDGVSPEIGMQDPDLKYAPPSVIKDWESTLVRWTKRARMEDVEKWRAAARMRAEAFLHVVAVFHEEDAPLLAGTDALNPWNVQGRSLHRELANFVAAGMSPFQALRCATSETARFLNESHIAGTVTAGKRADLVLLRSDPLEGIAALGDIEAVCVNGYYLPRSDLDHMLAQRAGLASEPAAIPRTSFSPEEMTWRERIVGAEAGRISFRHVRQPDGGWFIEERHAVALPRKHVERRSTRLVLDDELNVVSCEYTVESFAGSERGRLIRRSGGYNFELREVDGWESHGTLAAPPLPPSERLSATLWLLYLRDRKRKPFSTQVLDVENETLTTREIAFTPKDAESWQLAVVRPTQSTEQLYRFEDGRFAGLQETLPLLWTRELVP